jgi:hypothetical protein
MPAYVSPLTYKAEATENIKTVPEAASQTFVIGDPVYLVSGKVTVVTTSSSLMNVAPIGIAMEAASGTTDDPVKVLIADTEMEFVATMSNGTATTTWSAAYAAIAYDLRLNSSITSGATGFSVDRAATGNAHALVTGVVPGTENDSYPLVVFRIPTAKRQLGA